MKGSTRYQGPAGAAWQRRLLIAGFVGAALCGLAAILDVELFLRSYLFAYFSCVGIAVGSLAWWMLHNLTGGNWGRTLRPIWEAATRTLPVMALLFLPIAFGVGQLFPWAMTEASDLGSKAGYLNVPFFLARSAFYFALWIGMAWLLNRWSAEYDRTGDPQFAERGQRMSGPGLLLCGLSVSFAAVDWVMSLEPEWYSTIFGALIAGGFLLVSLAFSVAAATLIPPNAIATPATEVWNDLGNLLLAFVMIWTYLAFSQFLLIWSGNLPEEIIWYLHRTQGGWQWLGLSLAVGYFALPFCLLLSPDVKRKPDRLRAVAILLVAMSVLNGYWMIAPAFSPGVFRMYWTDLPAVVAVGGLWLASFLHQLHARPMPAMGEKALGGKWSHA